MRYVVNTDYNGIGKIQYIAASMDLFVADTKYTEEVEMELMIADELEDAFIKKVTEGTNGRAKITKKENISYVIVEGRVEFC